jgi:hypothetical protein
MRSTTPAQRRYLLSELLVSLLVNSLLSVLAAWVVFGQRESVVLWGGDGLAVDFLPQTFMVALMSTLVPGWLTRRRVQAGKIASLDAPPQRLPRNLLLRALLVAVLATFGFGGIAILVTSAVWAGALPTGSVILFKVLYGAMLSIPITRFGLLAALSDRVDPPT